MTLAIQSLLALIEQLLPLIGAGSNTALITGILETLSGFLPFIVQEVQQLYGPVKNIIGALSANPAATADQLATLQALDKQMDAAFEAAAVDTDNA